MKAIETKNLTKKYGTSRGITDLSLSVEAGEFYGFIGPNGAGKSTTIRTLLGYIKASSGTAKILDLDIENDIDKIHEKTGYLPSEITFYKGMKVKDIIKYSASLRNLKDTSEAKRLCDQLSLDTEKKVDELSLGNRKKVGIVCAVQHHPDLLILDEPTSGLDPLMQREFFNILKEEHKRGSTIFFSSHILTEVQEHCRMAAFIKDGKILVADEVENLKKTGAKKISVAGSLNTDILKEITHLSTSDDGKTTFLYNGEIKSLLYNLSNQEITDINISEPSLEEIFMHYYDTKGGESDANL